MKHGLIGGVTVNLLPAVSQARAKFHFRLPSGRWIGMNLFRTKTDANFSLCFDSKPPLVRQRGRLRFGLGDFLRNRRRSVEESFEQEKNIGKLLRIDAQNECWICVYGFGEYLFGISVWPLRIESANKEKRDSFLYSAGGGLDKARIFVLLLYKNGAKMSAAF